MARLICYLSGGCRWNTLREEWLPADKEHPTVRLLRFSECKYCGDTLATITSPLAEETLCNAPRVAYRFVHATSTNNT